MKATEEFSYEEIEATLREHKIVTRIKGMPCIANADRRIAISLLTARIKCDEALARVKELEHQNHLHCKGCYCDRYPGDVRDISPWYDYEGAGE